MLHNIFGLNTDYVILSGVLFAACLPVTVLLDSLSEGQVPGIMWSSETVPQDAHTKDCSCTQIVGKYSVHHMLQTRTYCTQLARLVKLDLSVKDKTSNSHKMTVEKFQLASYLLHCRYYSAHQLKKLS